MPESIFDDRFTIIPVALQSGIPGHLESRRRRNCNTTDVLGGWNTPCRRNFGPPLFPAGVVAKGVGDVSHQPLVDQRLIDQQLADQQLVD